MNEQKIKRGDIYIADLEKVKGSEQGGIRPVVIIQNNIGNRFSPTVIVAPVTSKVEKKHKQPTHVYFDKVADLDKSSVIMMEQLRTIDKSRLSDYMGHIDKENMNEINKALAISIGL